jgi:hypothetical protein
VVVARATRPGEQVIETTLEELPNVPKLPAPALLLVGVLPPASEASDSRTEITGKFADDH